MSRESDRSALNPRVWIYFADLDWVAARVLYRKKNPRLWLPAGLLGHKALEEYLKTYLRSYMSKRRWQGRDGHDLTRLAKSCARFDPAYFQEEHILQRLQTFWEIYQSWEYPRDIQGIKIDQDSSIEEIRAFFAIMETSYMAGDHLTIQDELVADIRPRINFANLESVKKGVRIFFPSQFTRFQGHLPEGRRLVRLARIDNPSFARMEREASKRHPPPRPIRLPRKKRGC